MKRALLTLWTRTAAMPLLRNRNVVLGAILAVGFCLRLGWLLYVHPEPVSDFQEYFQLASGLLDHHQYGYPAPTGFRTPGYPAFLAMVMAVSRSLTWLSLVNVLLSTSICLMVYLVARALMASDRVAMYACLFCAVYPMFVFFSPLLGSEHLATPMILGSLLLAMGKGRPILRAALAGLLLALAALVRGETVFLMAVVFGWILLRRTPEGRLDTRAGALPAACAAMTMVLVLGSWCVRNRVVIGFTGMGTVTAAVLRCAHRPGGYGQYPDLLPSSDELTSYHELMHMVEAYLLAHPESLVRTTLRGLQALYLPTSVASTWSTRVPQLVPDAPWSVKPLPGLVAAGELEQAGVVALMVLAALSLVNVRSWPHRARWTIGGLLLMHTACYAVVFLGDPRYRYFADVLFCIAAATVVVQLLEYRRSVAGGAR
jgi:hypothetical protein